MAPEVIARRGYLGDLADAWSLGCCIAAVLGGELPFAAKSDRELRRLVVSGAYRVLNRDALSDESLDLVARLLEVEPGKRLRAAAAREHAWLAPHYMYCRAAADGGDAGAAGATLAARRVPEGMPGVALTMD